MTTQMEVLEYIDKLRADGKDADLIEIAVEAFDSSGYSEQQLKSVMEDYKIMCGRLSEDVNKLFLAKTPREMRIIASYIKYEIMRQTE